MKKIVLLVGLIAGMGTVLFAQNAALPRLAVVPFSVNTERQKAREDAIAIRNFVQSNMVSSGKYNVITRDEIDKLLENQRIQVSSISSAENIKKLQLQNINYIVTGTVNAIDNDYGVTISILDVSSGRFSHSTSQFMSNTSTDIYNKTTALVRNFQQGLSNEGETVVQTGRSGNSKQYYIGDEGPAGGIVFFDKGEFSDGWRYLEAAPPQTENSARWGDVYVNQTTLGNGKKNTELIVDQLKKSGEIARAAQLCASLGHGGYRDWYLPSSYELDLMYQNLKRKGLGGFSNNWYWSSSTYQDGNGLAWGQGFSDGGRGGCLKNSTYLVRAVRAF